VTLDYILVFIHWDLNLKELKQLCLNSLNYASLHEQDKLEILNSFQANWSIFESELKLKL